MSNYRPPVMPYVEARHQGGRQRPTTIILSPSYTTSRRGAALGIAQAWHAPSSRQDSGHYAVDNETMFRCVRDRRVAGSSTESDKGSIRITICAEPVSRSLFWDINEHGRVLRNTAELVAELTLAYHIRVRYLSEEEMKHWEKWRSRRRGGIFLGETMANWPSEMFLAEVETQRALKKSERI